MYLTLTYRPRQVSFLVAIQAFQMPVVGLRVSDIHQIGAEFPITFIFSFHCKMISSNAMQNGSFNAIIIFI